MKLYATHKEALAHFATCRDYERHLGKGGDIYDNVQIGSILYTMDEYDMNGRYLTYGNKRTGMQLRVDTRNRYESKRDAKVWKWKADYYRNGIHYID